MIIRPARQLIRNETLIEDIEFTPSACVATTNTGENIKAQGRTSGEAFINLMLEIFKQGYSFSKVD